MSTKAYYSRDEIGAGKVGFSKTRSIIEAPFYGNNVIKVNTLREAYELAKNSPGTVVTDMPVYRGEEFGLEPGVNALDKLVSALKMMGAAEVYDTNFGADLTVMEEAAEFLERLKKGGPFPMFTSCCPAWIKYLEKENPKYLKHVSTCKSPMEMFAAVLKDQYKAKDAEDGRTTYHIAIMPCTAKKMEAAVEFAMNSPEPDPAHVLDDVFYEG